MEEVEKLIHALACLNEAEKYINDFKGERDFLENVKEPMADIKTFIADTITVNAKK